MNLATCGVACYTVNLETEVSSLTLQTDFGYALSYLVTTVNLTFFNSLLQSITISKS